MVASSVPAFRWLLCLLAFAPVGAHAADAATEKKAEVCVACHGPHGQSTNPAWPSLAGQTARYLSLELQDFQAGRRDDPLMSPIAKTLSTEDMQALADYFSKQRPMSSSYATDPAKVEQGRTIAANSLCAMCHEGGFAGQNEVPVVAGQQYQFIVKELEDFRGGRRTNDAGTMQAYTRGLSDQQIDALAQYITSLN